MVQGTVYGVEICLSNGLKCTYDGYFQGSNGTIGYLVWILDPYEQLLGHLEGRLDAASVGSRTDAWYAIDLRVRHAIRANTFQSASGLWSASRTVASDESNAPGAGYP